MASTSNPPHFFKIVLHHTLSQGKLEVPDTFVKRNRRALLNTKVWLKLGNGAIWEVGLEKIHGKIRFKYGWKEFMNFYSIKYGYLTVFRYEGSSCFHVLIFDTSGSEIKYPFQRNDVFCENDEESDSVSVSVSNSDLQILEDISSKKVVMQQPTHVLGSKRKTREKGKGKVQKEFKSKEVKRTIGEAGSVAKKSFKLNVLAQARVLKKATAFESTRNNPAFMVIMQVSYIVGKKMAIPKNFCDMHIKESSMMAVRVSDGRSWDVKCQVRIVSDKHRKVELSSGWKVFVRDNNLQLGDICVFELIESTELSLEATIFRSS